MIPNRLMAIVLLLLAALSGRAGSPFDLARMAQRTYGVESGLPTGTIYCFSLDAKGRLWAGTVDGAATYTGSGWVPVRLPRESASQYVRTILPAADGSLWFGTQDGGVWCRNHDQWTHLQGGRELPSDHIFCLAETKDAEGRATQWVGTADGGIAALSAGRWRTWGPQEGLPGGSVWRIREVTGPDGSRRLYAATEKGLCVLEGDWWHLLGPKEGFPTGDINDILDVVEADGSRSVWVSIWDRGLARWDRHGWTLYASGREFPGHAPTTTLCTTRDAAGRTLVWIGTLNEGLWWFRDGRWQSLGRGQGLLTAGILALFPVQDGKPTLLVGTRGSGVTTLDVGGWRTLDDSAGLPGPEPTCFTQTSDGAFWIGTTTGLASYRPGRGFERVGRESLPSDYIICLLPARDGLWVGTLGGLVRHDASGWHRIPQAAGLPPGMVICLLETTSASGRRTLWVGTPNGLGRFEDGRWRVITSRDGLPQDYVSSLCAAAGPGGEPDLWVGTRGGGVVRLRGGTWTSFGAVGQPNGNVYALHTTTGPDGHPWLWAGTLGGGLSRLDLRAPGHWEAFTQENLPGLTSNYIQRMEVDRLGRVYLSTSNGITRLTLDWSGGVPRPAKVDTFTLGDGLPSPSGSLGASFVDDQGRVWIGTSKGAAVLDPSLETVPGPPPAPVIERAVAEDPQRRLEPGERLGFRDRHLRFEFSMPVLHRKEDVRYQTQLVGLEAEPRPWHPEAWREFTALPPGQYEFRVWGRTFDGRTSGPVSFAFQVAPAPWRHPLAYLAYVLATAAAVLGLLRLRTRVLSERTRALEAAVNERTQVVERQALELEASNRALQGRHEELERTNAKNERLVQELSSALAEVKTLRGLIPICSYCKKIRDDEGLWAQMESYISQHSDAQFSHGICPDCRTRLLSERDTR